MFSRRSVSRPVVALLLYFLSVTVINSGDVKLLVTFLFDSIALSALMYLSLTWKNHGLLKGQLLLFEIMLCLNIVLQLSTPLVYIIKTDYYTRTVSNCLIGNNGIIRYLFPGAVISLIYSYIQKERMTIRIYLYLAAMFVSAILAKSTTSYVALFLTLLCLLINEVKPNGVKLITAKSIMLVSVVLCLIFVFVEQVSLINEIITNVLLKDTTLTGRTGMWSLALDKISEHLIYGRGYIGQNGFMSLLSSAYAAFSAHNIFLDVALRMGIVGIVLFGLILLNFSVKVDFYARTVKTVRSLAILFLLYSISWNFDVFIDSEMSNVLSSLVIADYLFSPGSILIKGRTQYALPEQGSLYNAGGKHVPHKLSQTVVE